MMTIETRPVDRLIPYVRNARTHSDDQIAQIAASIAEFGFINPILVGPDDVIIAGHGRLLAAKRLGLSEVPAIVLDGLTEPQRRALAIADNKLPENAGWNEELLRSELVSFRDLDFDLGLLGFTDEELNRLLSIDPGPGLSQAAASALPGEAPAPRATVTLAERFGIPPFSVLDARKGWWQERKRAWIDLGIRSELGRGAAPGGSPRPLDRARIAKAASPGGSPLPAANYSKSKARGDGRGKPIRSC